MCVCQALTRLVGTASITTVVCQDDRKMAQLLQSPPKCLKMLIAIKDITAETSDRAKKLGITIKYFEEVESMGAASQLPEMVSPAASKIVAAARIYSVCFFHFSGLSL